MQISSLPFVASVLLVVALLGTVVLVSDAGPQPTGAVTNQAEAERGTLARSVLAADDRSGDGVALPPITAAAALPEPTGGASPVTTPGAIPIAERAQCESGAAVGAGDPGLADDCAVLLAVKDTLRGTATTLNWDADTAIADWYGITVSGTPLRVTRLHLDGRNSRTSIGELIALTGTIPVALGKLSQLENLSLSRHALTGPIPPELGNLTELTTLSLHGNQLTGSIPPELGYLSNLHSLYLRSNQLTGNIPVELSKLQNLLILSLENNQFTGSIPVALTDLPELIVLDLYGNTMLTGCIPTGLPDPGLAGLTACTTTTTYALTTGSNGNGRVSPLPGTYSYLDGESVTLTATPDARNEITSWGGDCSGTATTCVLTMDADRAASVTFGRITHSLTVTVTGDGTVTPGGTTTQYEGDEVTLTASWSDATQDFDGWGGDCSGTATTCVLTVDVAKTVTAAFTALPAGRCATTTAADCIRAVYRGAPGDYAQVRDIPAALLLTPGADGRYYVERGHQITVVTAAPLPTGYTRFWLDRTPLEYGTPSSVSFSQLIKPVGTTYTFTVTDDEDASTLITFDLTAARPFVRPRPDGKPELGDVVVSTTFSVETSTFRYDTFDSTGEVTAAGSYAFVSDTADTSTAVTTYEALRDGTTTGLLVNKSDTHGASQAGFYDTVETGDVVEWREADQCWVRYRITATPASTLGATRAFGIAWVTYAATGCTGAANWEAAPTATLEWSPPNVQTPDVTSPIRHGPFLLIPRGWDGVLGARQRPSPIASREASRDSGDPPPVWPSSDIEEIRRHPLWNEPDIPEGWYRHHATARTDSMVLRYRDCCGDVEIQISQAIYSLPIHITHVGPNPVSGRIWEAREIDGHPAVLYYTPTNDTGWDGMVVIYDVASDIRYAVIPGHWRLNRDYEAVIAIARSLYD